MASAYLDYVDLGRIDTATRVADDLTGERDEFSSAPGQGRGLSYVRAQIQATVRARGIRSLMAMFDGGLPSQRSVDPVVADLLGGDALIARVMHDGIAHAWRQSILTSDVSEDMVQAALDKGFPALRQAAQYLVLKDESVAGVLIAYGSHHIPERDRQAVCCEAFRVLQSGGRIVIHDFPKDSPVARWFRDVVHPHSVTGHEHEHFERDELTTLLKAAGFTAVTVQMVYDPFVIVEPTLEQAWTALASYLVDMYGLELLRAELGHDLAVRRTLEMARDCFVYDYHALGLPPTFGVPAPSGHVSALGGRVECPRVAMVATGTKEIL